ncbi:MAG: hypothetical protein ACI4RV_06465 [Eubacteriales bacterium]
MSFKKMSSVNLSYKKQGLIHFICQNYADMPEEMQKKIDALCLFIGKTQYKDALKKAVTTEEPHSRIAREFYMSPRQLYRYKRQFYSEWFRFRKY